MLDNNLEAKQKYEGAYIDMEKLFQFYIKDLTMSVIEFTEEYPNEEPKCIQKIGDTIQRITFHDKEFFVFEINKSPEGHQFTLLALVNHSNKRISFKNLEELRYNLRLYDAMLNYRDEISELEKIISEYVNNGYKKDINIPVEYCDGNYSLKVYKELILFYRLFNSFNRYREYEELENYLHIHNIKHEIHYKPEDKILEEEHLKEEGICFGVLYVGENFDKKIVISYKSTIPNIISYRLAILFDEIFYYNNVENASPSKIYFKKR